MRLTILICLLATAAAAQQGNAPPATAAVPEVGANLPAQSVGPNDLIVVSVYGSPEFSGPIRVSSDGYIRLPILKERIKAQGLMPQDLEGSIGQALEKAGLLVAPFVTVNIAEYSSRPITVSGAVRQPLEFQAASPTPLLDAIAKAGGLTDNAGSEVLVTQTQPGPDGRPVSHTRHIPSHSLLNDADADLNIILNGGEQVIVPEAAKVYVGGYVKVPNAYKVQDNGQISVREVLTLTQGLAPYAGKVAYIYRPDGAGGRVEISVPLAKIQDRKAPDVPLLADDIFYVPDNKGKRITLTTIDKVAPIAGGVAAALIYVAHP